jgi:hypothetical protein
MKEYLIKILFEIVTEVYDKIIKESAEIGFDRRETKIAIRCIACFNEIITKDVRSFSDTD